MQTINQKAREVAEEVHGDDGRLPVDESAQAMPIGNGAYEVKVWAWVSNEEADVANNGVYTAEERETLFLKAVALDNKAPSHVTFRNDAEVAPYPGDDGAYVSGWVRVTLEPTETQIMQSQIMDAADTAYENGELYLDQKIPSGQRGDLLADFLAAELREVMEGAESPEEARKEAIRAIASATRQLSDVKEALLATA